MFLLLKSSELEDDEFDELEDDEFDELEEELETSPRLSLLALLKEVELEELLNELEELELSILELLELLGRSAPYSKITNESLSVLVTYA